MPTSEDVGDFITSYDIDMPLGQYLYGSESFVSLHNTSVAQDNSNTSGGNLLVN